jgi:hypothetical protein
VSKADAVEAVDPSYTLGFGPSSVQARDWDNGGQSSCSCGSSAVRGATKACFGRQAQAEGRPDGPRAGSARGIEGGAIEATPTRAGPSSS